MSHYLSVKCTALTDVKIPILKEALKKMDSTYGLISSSKVGKNIPTYRADALLTMNGVPSKIGFTFKENGKKTSMEIGGEFYRTGFDLNGFSKKLCYNYSVALVENMIRKNRYRPIKQKIDEDGTIHMTVEVAA